MTLHARQPSDEIPTSSMADIAFLLIIYFMLAATFAATRGLDYGLDSPEGDDSLVVDPVESVLVEVLTEGSLRVDTRPLPIADLLDYLHPRLAQDPKKPVILQTAPDAPYGAMVTTLDVLRQGKDVLGLAEEIQIAIPTQRERDLFWR